MENLRSLEEIGQILYGVAKNKIDLDDGAMLLSFSELYRYKEHLSWMRATAGSPWNDWTLVEMAEETIKLLLESKQDVPI